MRSGATESAGIYTYWVAPKKISGKRGHAYPVKESWQEDVLKAIDRLGLKEKQLAKQVGCAQSSMHDLLHSPDARHSSLVPAIHAALGWDPPPDPQAPVPLPSPDAIELGHMFDRLPEKLRAQMIQEAKTYLELLGSQKPEPSGSGN